MCGFDFVVTPLVRPDHRPPAYQPDAHGTLPNPFNRDDVLYMGSTQWVRQVSDHRHLSAYSLENASDKWATDDMVLIHIILFVI